MTETDTTPPAEVFIHLPFKLDTERNGVKLRQLTIENAPAYFAAIDASREHLGDIADKYPTLESVEASILKPDNRKKLRMGIWDGDIFVGTATLTHEAQTAEIGYWLDANNTGQGYATLAVRALADYANNMSFNRTLAKVRAENEAGIRVLDRAGFRRTAKKAGVFLVYQYFQQTKS